MSEQIETAEELDALPVGSVVLDRFGDAATHDQPRVWLYAETRSMGTARLVRYGPFRVLYRPDAPVTAGATVTAEQVEAARDEVNGYSHAGYAPPGWPQVFLTALGLTVVDGPTEGGGDRG